MSNFRNFVDLFFSAVIVITYAYTLIRDTELFNGPKLRELGFPYDDTFCGRAKFLTFLNMIVQLTYFVVSFFKALFNLFSKRDFNIICDRFYCSLSFPFSLIVTATFWIIYSINRDLMYPVELDAKIPRWINHVKHTLPLVACLINNVIVSHSYPKFIKGVSITMITGSLYLIWIFYIGHMSNRWVYGFLEKMSYPQRIIFALFQILTGVISYKIGEIFNDILWKSTKIKIK